MFSEGFGGYGGAFMWFGVSCSFEEEMVKILREQTTFHCQLNNVRLCFLVYVRMLEPLAPKSGIYFNIEIIWVDSFPQKHLLSRKSAQEALPTIVDQLNDWFPNDLWYGQVRCSTTQFAIFHFSYRDQYLTSNNQGDNPLNYFMSRHLKSKMVDSPEIIDDWNLLTEAKLHLLK